jgi:hypothetical protein
MYRIFFNYFILFESFALALDNRKINNNGLTNKNKQDRPCLGDSYRYGSWKKLEVVEKRSFLCCGWDKLHFKSHDSCRNDTEWGYQHLVYYQAENEYTLLTGGFEVLVLFEVVVVDIRCVFNFLFSFVLMIAMLLVYNNIIIVIIIIS